MKINVINVSPEYKCQFIDVGTCKRLWIVETNRADKTHVWYPTFSKYCKHEVMGGECINCGLVIEED